MLQIAEIRGAPLGLFALKNRRITLRNLKEHLDNRAQAADILRALLLRRTEKAADFANGLFHFIPGSTDADFHRIVPPAAERFQLCAGEIPGQGGGAVPAAFLHSFTQGLKTGKVGSERIAVGGGERFVGIHQGKRILRHGETVIGGIARKGQDRFSPYRLRRRPRRLIHGGFFSEPAPGKRVRTYKIVQLADGARNARVIPAGSKRFDKLEKFRITFAVELIQRLVGSF